jgi:hypothetical protein
MKIPTKKYNMQYPIIHSCVPNAKLKNLPTKTRINTFLIDLSSESRTLKVKTNISYIKLVIRPTTPRED